MAINKANKSGVILRGRAGDEEFWCRAVPHSTQRIRWNVHHMKIQPSSSGLRINEPLGFELVPKENEPFAQIQDRIRRKTGVKNVEFDVLFDPGLESPEE
jgi:hypothetical protein